LTTNAPALQHPPPFKEGFMSRFILSSALLVLTGCGAGAVPEIYAVSVDFFRPADTCYVNAMPPSIVTTSGGQAPLQWQIWDGPENKAYLELEQGGGTIDMGDAPNVVIGGTLEGTQASGDWTFTTGRTTTSKSPLANATTTDTTHATVTTTRSAGTVKGTLKLEATRTCEGTGCPANFAMQNPSCTIEGIALRGTRIAVTYERAP
jgi:hypothetical protein